MEKKEYRRQYRFWLDVMQPGEDDLAKYIDDLKKTRHFAQTIRDGLRLIRDLRQGKVDVLLSLFPWIEDYFRPTTAVTVALPDPVQAYLERMERYFEQIGRA